MLLLMGADASWGHGGAAPVPVDLHIALLGSAFLCYSVIVAVVLRRELDRRVLTGLIIRAVTLRMLVLLGPHRHNSEVWRYLWDGHLLASGHNPWTHVPDDPAPSSLSHRGCDCDLGPDKMATDRQSVVAVISRPSGHFDAPSDGYLSWRAVLAF